jgi:hypothetical protein
MARFCNTLREGDPVRTTTGQDGTVAKTPRETSVFTLVRLGNARPRYVHVDLLRFCVGGVPEEVPPYDGEVPDNRRITAKAAASIATPEFTAIEAIQKKKRLLLAKLEAYDEALIRLIVEAALKQKKA